MALIEVNNIVKEFKVSKKKSGLSGAVNNLFSPATTIVKAVDDISFKIDKGEIVGYIGPNGAGKSTTVKMMSGILQPTSGIIRIDGISPQSNRIQVVKKLGVVFGQRTQLYWDLRLGESFELLKRIYRIENTKYKSNLELLSEVLNLKDIIDIPVRQLSLGQRMKGDLAASMLHSPLILFLDEPTIGLDVEAKYAMRKFIKEINKINGTTVILTTHDLDDVEQLCERIIVINHGSVIEDGPLENIVERLAPYRYLILELYNDNINISHPYAEFVKKVGTRVWLRFEKSRITAAELIADLSKNYMIKDLSVEEADIEDVVRKVYKGDVSEGTLR